MGTNWECEKFGSWWVKLHLDLQNSYSNFFSQSESRCSTSKFSLSQREFWCSRSNSTFIYIYFQFFSPKVSLDVQHPDSIYFLLFFPSKANLDIQHLIPLFFFFFFFFNMKSECWIFKFLSLSAKKKKMKAILILSFLLSRRAIDNTKRNTIRNEC